MITLEVNGAAHTLDIDPSMPLLYALRNHLQLNGAKFGCGLGQCGACTVLVGDAPVYSCLMPVAAVGTRAVRTIEGLSTPAQPGVLPQAFIDQQAAQCGYCIAGMVMRAQALLERQPSPTEAQIRAHMAPNLCRCGTHKRILAAIREAARVWPGSLKTPHEAGKRGGTSPSGESGQTHRAQVGRTPGQANDEST